MNRLGRYLHTTRQGLAIVKLKELPALGAKVADEKGRIIGQVADVFGPISAPYCSIRLQQGGGVALDSGGELYLAERKQVSRGRKHGRN